MKLRTGFKAGTLVAALVAGLIVSSSARAGILDQSSESVGGGWGTEPNGGTYAQTFTAGLTGKLDRVDLKLVQSNNNPCGATVTIRTVSGGVPVGILTGATIPASSIKSVGDKWVSVPLSNPTTVGKGSQYAIVLSTQCGIGWVILAGEYPGGHRITCCPFTPAPGSDYQFRTYVAVPVQGPPPIGGNPPPADPPPADPPPAGNPPPADPPPAGNPPPADPPGGGAPPADTTPPDTVLTSEPLTKTRDKTPTFTFESNDPGARFECTVDGGALSACTSPLTVAPLKRGRAHTFAVRAIDAAGNADPTPVQAAFKVQRRRHR